MYINKLVKFEQSSFEEQAFNPRWQLLADAYTVLASNGTKCGFMLPSQIHTYDYMVASSLTEYKNASETTVRNRWNTEGILYSLNKQPSSIDDWTIETPEYPFFDINSHTYRLAKIKGVVEYDEHSNRRFVLYWILDDNSRERMFGPDTIPGGVPYYSGSFPSEFFIYPLVGYQWNVYTNKFDLRMSFIISIYDGRNLGTNICAGGLNELVGKDDSYTYGGKYLMDTKYIHPPYGTVLYPNADPEDEFFAYGIECDPAYAADPTNWYRSTTKREYFTTTNYILDTNVNI